jgi:hypothetical protein
MTTGRINQVCELTDRHSAPWGARHPPATPQRSNQVLHSVSPQGGRIPNCRGRHRDANLTQNAAPPEAAEMPGSRAYVIAHQQERYYS